MRFDRLSSYQKRKIGQLYSSGISMRKIALLCGFSSGSSVKCYLKKLGIVIRDRRYRISIPEGIKELYLSGLSQYQIAQRFNTSQRMVGSWLKQVGVESRFSKKCKFQLEGHPAWKGGITKKKDGRIKVKCYGHPRADSNGYVYRQILVWEKANGPIPEGYVVHHLNGIKDDDRISNFSLMKKSEHSNWLILHEAQKRIRELEKQILALKKED